MESRSSTSSHFKKTVTLHNWWLIKPDTKALGVAGITSTSQQNRKTAARSFTSAPISKVFDIFELETVDDVCIILQGFINQDRTLQNGFSPEVFKHFVFGFPVYWEEFAAICPETGSTVLQESVEGHDVFRDCHDHFSDPEMKDCQDAIDKTTVFHTTSSPEPIVNTGDEVLCEKTTATLEVKDDPRLVMNQMGMDVDGIKRNVVKKAVASSKCLVGSSRRMTRSMKKAADSSKCLRSHDIFHLDKVILDDPVNLESTDISREDKNDELNSNKAGEMSGSMKNIPNVSDGCGKESNGIGSCFEDTVRSKRKQDQNVDADEDIRNKLTFQDGQEKNKEGTYDVSGDIQILKGRSYIGVKRSKSECLKSPTPSVGCQRVIASSIEDFNFASTVSNVNDNPSKANMKPCRNKKKNKKEEIPAAHRTDSKKTVITRSTSKSKVTPQREMAKKQPLITTPTSTRKKASKDLFGSPNIMSPEDFSGKKSRSGRVLLPKLEFWRNQKVVYDKDHRAYGIQEPI